MKPILSMALLLAIAVACGQPQQPQTQTYVASMPAVAMILREVAGDRAAISTLLPPGGSPHTYSPRPADAMACEQAKLVFVVGPTLDAWAARLAPPEKTVALLDFISEEMRLPLGDADQGHSGDDPHFWTDPLMVQSILPTLADRLAAADPAGAAVYRANAAAFAERLGDINREAFAQLGPLAGRSLVFFHPSFNYLLRRYGLESAGEIEPIPGRNPTAAELILLRDAALAHAARAIVAEPQLPDPPAKLVAEMTGLKIARLNVDGAAEGADYAAWLAQNVAALAEALQ